MLWVMSTHNMFLWRNKKNIKTFELKKKKKHLIKIYDSIKLIFFNQKVLTVFLFLYKNKWCEYSSEMPQQGDFNEYLHKGWYK